MKEQFFDEQYSQMNVSKKIVVDIGANIGDSAIYFALKGAKHVYAYEPFPYSFKIAKINVAKNRLHNKISLFNEGCGKDKSKIRIPEELKSISGSELKDFKQGKLVKLTTLRKIVTEHSLKNAVLKMDCEGCEYPIILNSDTDTLRHFSEITLEYHKGYQNLEKKLKNAGFTVSHTLPKSVSSDDGKINYVGILHALRVSS